MYFLPEVRSAKSLKNKNISIFFFLSESHKFLKAFQQNEPRSLGKLLAYDLGKRGFPFCGKLHCQHSSALKITFRVKTSSDCCQHVPLPARLHQRPLGSCDPQLTIGTQRRQDVEAKHSSLQIDAILHKNAQGFWTRNGQHVKKNGGNWVTSALGINAEDSGCSSHR